MDEFEGTVPAPKNWENNGGWKLHYRVPHPRQISDKFIAQLQADITPERREQLQADWSNPNYEAKS